MRRFFRINPRVGTFIAILFSTPIFLTAQQPLNPKTYHSFVELALSGEELNTDLVEGNELENVADQLLKLGEFGALIHLFSKKSDSLPPLLRYVHGVILAETGDPAGAFHILLPLYEELSNEREYFLTDPTFYKVARDSVPVAFSYLRRRPLLHVPSGLEAFREPEDESLINKVKCHLATAIYWTRGQCLFYLPGINRPPGEKIRLADWANENPDSVLLRGIAIKWDSSVETNWLLEAASFVEPYDSELALVAFAKIAQNGDGKRISIEKLQELSLRLKNPKIDGLNALVELVKEFPALAHEVEETFVEATKNNTFFPSSQILDILNATDRVHLRRLVRSSLDDSESIAYWKRVDFTVPGKSLWIGSDNALRENGLNPCLVGLLKDKEFEPGNDEWLRTINHIPWKLALAEFENHDSLAAELSEKLASGTSSERYLAATWFEEKGELERALGLLRSLEEHPAASAILKWTQLLEFCFRNQSELDLEKDLLKSIRKLQFYPIPKKQRHRLVDIAFQSGIQTEIVIDKNRYRGFHGSGHPEPLFDEIGDLATPRFARLGTLERLLLEQSHFTGSRISLQTGGERSFDPKSTAETARRATAMLINGNGASARRNFYDLLSRYPAKELLLLRWIESCVADEAGGTFLIRFLENQPDFRIQFLNGLEHSPAERLQVYECLAKGIPYAHTENFREILSGKILAIVREEIRTLGNLQSAKIEDQHPPENGSRVDEKALHKLINTLLHSAEFNTVDWLNLVVSKDKRITEKNPDPEEIFHFIEKNFMQANGPPNILPLQRKQEDFLLLRVLLESDRTNLEAAKSWALRLSEQETGNHLSTFLSFIKAAEEGRDSLQDFTFELYRNHVFSRQQLNALLELPVHQTWKKHWGRDKHVVSSIDGLEKDIAEFSIEQTVNHIVSFSKKDRHSDAWELATPLLRSVLSDFDIGEKRNSNPILARMGNRIFSSLAGEPELFAKLSEMLQDEKFYLIDILNEYQLRAAFAQSFDSQYQKIAFPENEEETIRLLQRFAKPFLVPLEEFDPFPLPTESLVWEFQTTVFGQVALSLQNRKNKRSFDLPTPIREEWSKFFAGRLLLLAWDGDIDSKWKTEFERHLPELAKLPISRQMNLSSILGVTDSFGMQYSGKVDGWVSNLHIQAWSRPKESPLWKRINDSATLDNVIDLFQNRGTWRNTKDRFGILKKRSEQFRNRFHPSNSLSLSRNTPFEGVASWLMLPEEAFKGDAARSMRLLNRRDSIRYQCSKWAEKKRTEKEVISDASILAKFQLEMESEVSAIQRSRFYPIFFGSDFQKKLPDSIRETASVAVNALSPDPLDWTRDYLLSTKPPTLEELKVIAGLEAPASRLIILQVLYAKSGARIENEVQQKILSMAVQALSDLSHLPDSISSERWSGHQFPWPESTLLRLIAEDNEFPGLESLITDMHDSWKRILEQLPEPRQAKRPENSYFVDSLFASALNSDHIDLIECLLNTYRPDELLSSRAMLLQLIANGHIEAAEVFSESLIQFPRRLVIANRHSRKFRYGLELQKPISDFCDRIEDKEIALYSEIFLAMDAWDMQRKEIPRRLYSEDQEKEYLEWLARLQNQVENTIFEKTTIQSNCLEILGNSLLAKRRKTQNEN